MSVNETTLSRARQRNRPFVPAIGPDLQIEIEDEDVFAPTVSKTMWPGASITNAGLSLSFAIIGMTAVFLVGSIFRSARLAEYGWSITGALSGILSSYLLGQHRRIGK